jgi:glycosyltransferase involved in cell wall biosynthesis
VPPRIAVIVPACDAAATIGATLEALAAQDFDGEHEVVVVDDASADATPDLAESAGLRVVRLTDRQGPAGARNAGIAATTAPLLAFTDADCVPSPGWLSAVAAALEDADLVTGPVEPDPAAPRGPFDRTLHVDARSPRFETANLAVRRAAADAVGGFEAFAHADGRPGCRPRPGQGHFGEDALFGWRVVRSGGTTAFADAALVHHAVFARGARGYLAERPRLRFFPALARDVPEIRRRLPLRVFLSPRSAAFDLAVAGVLAALASRRPLLVAAALPYVRRHLWWTGFWRRWTLKVNATLLLGDLIGLVALVRGSLAARRPLL